MITIDMESRNLTGAMRQLARMTGRSFRDVVRAETQAALNTAQKSKRMKSASETSITKSIDSRPFFTLHESEYAARDRGDVRVTKNGFVKYSTNRKYPNAIWEKAQAAKDASISKRIKSRGLQRKVFLQLAEKLSLKINVPAYVRNANANGKDYPNDAQAKEHGTVMFTIECEIRRTYQQEIKGALISAIKGRRAFFLKNLRDGVFKNSKTIAAKYPGLVNG